MSESLALVLGLAGIFVALAMALSTVGTATSQRHQVHRSLVAVQSLQAAPLPLQHELSKPFADRVLTPGLARLTQLGRRFTAGEQVARLKHRLELAGNPPRWDVDRVIAFKMLGIIAAPVTVGSVASLAGTNVLTVVGLSLAAAALGYFAPNLALHQVAYERSDRIRRELAEALDLLTISVEAGLAFDAALSQVARKTTGPLAQEFFRVLQEMQIGLGRAESLRALADRTDVAELRGFVTAMIQAESFGIPVASVLRIQAKEMRVKRSQRAEELAQKVPVKILFPLIFCILPALFVVVLGPAAITILGSFGSGL